MLLNSVIKYFMISAKENRYIQFFLGLKLAFQILCFKNEISIRLFLLAYINAIIRVFN